jgi:transposase
MKNRYLKNARIPERKVRELLNLFCEDLTATQIANISGISRITVNAYLKLIRIQIAQYCEEQSPYGGYNGQLLLIANKEPEQEADHTREHSFYGISKSGQTIYTKNITNIDEGWLNNWVRGKISIAPSTLEENTLHFFDAIADFSRTKLYRVNNALPFIKPRSTIDEIDLFWGILKSRIVKFRGLNTGTTYLHIKESEFRYNNRNADLFALVHSLIQRRPLHYLKQEATVL